MVIGRVVGKVMISEYFDTKILLSCSVVMDLYKVEEEVYQMLFINYSMSQSLDNVSTNRNPSYYRRISRNEWSETGLD